MTNLTKYLKFLTILLPWLCGIVGRSRKSITMQPHECVSLRWFLLKPFLLFILELQFPHNLSNLGVCAHLQQFWNGADRILSLKVLVQWQYPCCNKALGIENYHALNVSTWVLITDWSMLRDLEHHRPAYLPSKSHLHLSPNSLCQAHIQLWKIGTGK